MAFVAGIIPFLMLGETAAVDIGTNHFINSPRDLRDRSVTDIFALGPTLFKPNSSRPQSSDFRNMVVLAHPDTANDTATFYHGLGESVGVFTGWPKISPSGVMQGELSVVVPGLDEPLQGTWLTVRSGNASSPEQVAFDHITGKLQKAAGVGRPEDMGLEGLLSWVAEIAAKDFASSSN